MLETINYLRFEQHMKKVKQHAKVIFFLQILQLYHFLEFSI